MGRVCDGTRLRPSSTNSANLNFTRQPSFIDGETEVPFGGPFGSHPECHVSKIQAELTRESYEKQQNAPLQMRPPQELSRPGVRQSDASQFDDQVQLPRLQVRDLPAKAGRLSRQ